uniref:Protein phosphatase 2C, putative n=1 Tax=Neospora caninum (strain Liverpool) TaxID=572307 RepID=A0A0F7UK52_NEOCL|nr:TPA: protein phosphatase 2C, putative [Neospora caninum Liverpool]
MSQRSGRPRLFAPPSRARRAYERHRRELAEFTLSRQQQPPPEPLVKRLTTLQLMKEKAKEEDRKEKFKTEFSVGLVVKKRPRTADEQNANSVSPSRPPRSSVVSPSSVGPLLPLPRGGAPRSFSASPFPALSSTQGGPNGRPKEQTLSPPKRNCHRDARRDNGPDQLHRKAKHSPTFPCHLAGQSVERHTCDIAASKLSPCARSSSPASAPGHSSPASSSVPSSPASSSSSSDPSRSSSSVRSSSAAFLSEILSAYPDEESLIPSASTPCV